MKRLLQPEDNQTKAYVVQWDGDPSGFKVWRPDFVPHLSVLIFAKKDDAQKSANKINEQLKKKGFGQ